MLSTFQSEGEWLHLADMNGDGMDDFVLLGEEVDDAYRYSPAYWGHSGRVRLSAGDGELLPPVEVAGLDARTWYPAHLDDDGVLDLAGFWMGDIRCGLPACAFYGPPLRSNP